MTDPIIHQYDLSGRLFFIIISMCLTAITLASIGVYAVVQNAECRMYEADRHKDEVTFQRPDGGRVRR